MRFNVHRVSIVAFVVAAVFADPLRAAAPELDYEEDGDVDSPVAQPPDSSTDGDVPAAADVGATAPQAPKRSAKDIEALRRLRADKEIAAYERFADERRLHGWLWLGATGGVAGASAAAVTVFSLGQGTSPLGFLSTSIVAVTVPALAVAVTTGALGYQSWSAFDDAATATRQSEELRRKFAPGHPRPAKATSRRRAPAGPVSDKAPAPPPTLDPG